MADPPTETARAILLATAAHRRLVDALDHLGVDLDIGGPSRLAGWTRGHVLAHVANSGDGHCGIFEAAGRGEVADQYPGGVQQRAADIEAGATRLAEEQVQRLRESIERLERAWEESAWQGRGRGPRGEIAVTDLPYLRLREVAIHHVDLDIGYEFGDLPGEYVRLEVRRLEMLWKARQPMGLTSLPSAARQLSPPDRLAWLTGRLEVPGLAAANVF